MMVGSFEGVETEELYHGRSTRRFCRFSPEICNKALVKFDMLNAATAWPTPWTIH